jgi:hypothetical protein
VGLNPKQVKIFHIFFLTPPNPHGIEITEQVLSVFLVQCTFSEIQNRTYDPHSGAWANINSLLFSRLSSNMS